MEDPTALRLAAIRAKTDRQLSIYIREQLNSAARFAFQADEARRIRNEKRARRLEQRAASAMRSVRELTAILRSTSHAQVATIETVCH